MKHICWLDHTDEDVLQVSLDAISHKYERADRDTQKGVVDPSSSRVHTMQAESTWEASQGTKNAKPGLALELLDWLGRLKNCPGLYHSQSGQDAARTPMQTWPAAFIKKS